MRKERWHRWFRDDRFGGAAQNELAKTRVTICAHDQQVDFFGGDELRQDVSDRSTRGTDFIDDNVDSVSG